MRGIPLYMEFEWPTSLTRERVSAVNLGIVHRTKSIFETLIKVAISYTSSNLGKGDYRESSCNIFKWTSGSLRTTTYEDRPRAFDSHIALKHQTLTRASGMTFVHLTPPPHRTLMRGI